MITEKEIPESAVVPASMSERAKYEPVFTMLESGRTFHGMAKARAMLEDALCQYARGGREAGLAMAVSACNRCMHCGHYRLLKRGRKLVEAMRFGIKTWTLRDTRIPRPQRAKPRSWWRRLISWILGRR